MKDIKSQAELSKAINTETITIVDFWAEWCNPCKALIPILEKIKEDYTKLKIVKVNVEDNTILAQSLGVKSLPTLIIFKSGKEVERITGLVADTKIRKMIDEVLKS